MSMGLWDGVLTNNIIIGLGFASVGGMSLAGSLNWFELLNSTKSNCKKAKTTKDYQWLVDRTNNNHKIVENNHKIVVNNHKIVENKSSKKTKQHVHYNTRTPVSSTKTRTPAIKVKKTSVVDFVHVITLDSSDEQDLDDNENFVYECPGLAASAEDMTVENPLFNEKRFQESYRTPELARKFWKDVFAETI